MNPEIKEEWVEALRSGEYEQTQGYLNALVSKAEKNAFCCLGVLCEIAVKHDVIPSATFKDHDDWDIYSYGDSYQILPESVASWAGIPSTSPSVANGYEIDEETGESVINYELLADLNDAGASFNEIATLIEESL